MYKLTLSHDERKAIDWVGYRYDNGDYLRNLIEEGMSQNNPEYDCDFWNNTGDIEFHIPENIAAAIKYIADENNYIWPCFSPEFSTKLNNFCEQIV